MSDKCCSNCCFLHEKAVYSEMMWHCGWRKETIYDPDKHVCTDWTECEKPAKSHTDNYCTWKRETDLAYSENDIYWETDCGRANSSIEGTPSDNNYKYCPYCGKGIKEVKEE